MLAERIYRDLQRPERRHALSSGTRPGTAEGFPAVFFRPVHSSDGFYRGGKRRIIRLSAAPPVPQAVGSHPPEREGTVRAAFGASECDSGGTGRGSRAGIRRSAVSGRRGSASKGGRDSLRGQHRRFPDRAGPLVSSSGRRHGQRRTGKEGIRHDLPPAEAISGSRHCPRRRP